MSSVKLDKYQRAVVSFVEDNDQGNASAIAVAGAGKTTTLLAAANAVPKSTLGYAVVFNRKNANELRARFPHNIACGTFHSFWVRACRKALGNVTVDGGKIDLLITRVLPIQPPRSNGEWGGAPRTQRQQVQPLYRQYVQPVKKLVGYARAIGVGLLVDDVYATWREMLDYLDIDIDTSVNVEQLVKFAQQLLALSNATLDMIDFDDMLYLPLINGWGIERRPFVFIDEAQDTNAVQRALIARMLSPKGRALFVGDPHQAIYGFRGATSNAMDVIEEQFQTKTLPLTVSYRCPRAVVEYSRQYVDHIRAHASAPEGEVKHVRSDALPRELMTSSTAIVCRLTAPLVQFAVKLLAERIPARVLGRDVGASLVSLINAHRVGIPDSLVALLDNLETWRDREVAKFQAKFQDDKAQSCIDRYEAIEALISFVPIGTSIDGLIREIQFLFVDNEDNAVVCATVHKAKGLEWENVIIIRPDKMPLPFVKSGTWQYEQELNIAYVAATRAKQTLIIADGETVGLEPKRIS
jgi:superfamily I DNA/RNA helicase